MSNYNYIFSAIGWMGFTITLILLLFVNRCEKPTQVIEKQTIVQTFFDSAVKIVEQKSYLPGQIIYTLIPQTVDTAKIIALYFSKIPYSRTFEDSLIRATLVDTVSQNLLSRYGHFSYQWLKPIKTVESTTLTVTGPEAKKPDILIGLYSQFNRYTISSFGPELYFKSKKGNLYGINYDLKNNAFGIKAAISLHEKFRNKGQ